jgi:hypothetical protein
MAYGCATLKRLFLSQHQSETVLGCSLGKIKCSYDFNEQKIIVAGKRRYLIHTVKNIIL